jgi:peptidoglycan/LPS O-acetylase OafA/YrhL
MAFAQYGFSTLSEQESLRKVIRMNRQTSLHLDLVRFLAALTVFVSHICGQRFTGGLLWQSEPYGDEAVDVFFVLSGFVIGYVTDGRETSARSFAVARLARIYSVALPALVTTFILDAIGRAVRPDLYAEWWGYLSDDRFLQFASSLIFCNRLWWLHVTQGSNVSYWSLSYEVWYYIIFSIAVFGGERRLAWALFAAVVAGPNIISLFPLWLLGVLSYRLCSQVMINSKAGSAISVASLALWTGYELWAWKTSLRHIGPTDIVRRDQILQDYIVGVLFAANLVGFHAASRSWGVARHERLAKCIRWAAGATFTIYLFHVPIAQFLTTIVPWPPTSWATRLIMFPGVLTLMFVIAELTERRKDWWRRLFALLVDKLFGMRVRQA